MLNRRQFLHASAGTAAFFAFRRRAYAFQQTPILSKFSISLPGLGPTAANQIGQYIPVAVPQRTAGYDVYKLVAQQFTEQMHPKLGPTTFWGYADATSGAPINKYLGPVIVAQKGRPVKLTMVNGLAGKTHPLPVDTSIMGAELGQADNRITVHLHGGLVPWTSDGGPFTWFAPDGTHGPDFLNGNGIPGQAEYYYPNDQSARLVWYHDHSFGTTRLNAYAGLASGYIIRDSFESALISAGLVPSDEIPLIIQDKTFQPSGLLWYPTTYDQTRWDYGPNVNPPAAVTGPLPTPSAIPEYFSDTILVNGAVYPYVEIQPKRYRFRVLNGSNARFYNLQLYFENTAMAGEADLSKPGPAILQIGTEGGFLPVPVVLNNPPVQIGFDTNPASPTFGNANRYNLLLAPAERADLIIDFSAVAPGSRLVLYNDAPAPFPMGDPLNDYYTGDPDQQSAGGAASTLPGYGPNTHTLLQFRVVPGSTPRAASVPWGTLLSSLSSLLGQTIVKIGQNIAVRTRDVTLNEDFDELGRLIQRLGTSVPNGLNTQGNPTFARNYMDPVTESPKAGDIEIWRIFNLTGDTHPMHFHLVNVQVIGRQPFDAAGYGSQMSGGAAVPKFTGPMRPPDANELGWKETVRVNPNEMAMVIMKFDLAKTPTPVPLSPRTGGHEFVWHCHILEHEEHDMMRPLVVRP
jgi:spore coat protein A